MRCRAARPGDQKAFASAPHRAPGGFLHVCGPILCLCVLAISASALATPAVRVIPNPSPAISIFRNSHATAGAWLVKHCGFARENESDRTLVATAWVYMRRCSDCGDPKRVTWHVADGLTNMLKARGGVLTPTERCTRPAGAGGTATFSDYTSAIQAGRPVLVTFCYDPRAATSVAVAKGRTRDCLTVAGIGYVVASGKHFLIARDGLESAGGIAEGDMVSPGRLGLTRRGVWSERGTRIYRWEGSYTNIVLTLAPGPARRTSGN